MNYSNQLVEIYKEAINNKDYTKKLNQNILKNIQILSEKSFNQKGVFTVLVTLSIYKINHLTQDIRLHRKEFENGFSGRSFDTK